MILYSICHPLPEYHPILSMLLQMAEFLFYGWITFHCVCVCIYIFFIHSCFCSPLPSSNLHVLRTHHQPFSLPQKHLILIFPLLLAPTLKTASSPSIYAILQCRLHHPKVQMWLFPHFRKFPHWMEEKIQTTHTGILDLSIFLCSPQPSPDACAEHWTLLQWFFIDS